MGHNVSRTKREEVERARRVEALALFLVPGWQIDHTRCQIVEIKSALGHYQRGQQVLLRCRRTDCRRRVEMDLGAAVHAGHGDRPIAHLLQLLRCRHWSGCELEEAGTTYPRGVPLVGFLQHEDVLVAIACIACDARLLLPPAKVIEHLRAAGRGDGATGVLELGGNIRGPCRRCGGRRFKSEVVWPRSVVGRSRSDS